MLSGKLWDQRVQGPRIYWMDIYAVLGDTERTASRIDARELFWDTRIKIGSDIQLMLAG